MLVPLVHISFVIVSLFSLQCLLDYLRQQVELLTLTNYFIMLAISIMCEVTAHELRWCA